MFVKRGTENAQTMSELSGEIHCEKRKSHKVPCYRKRQKRNIKLSSSYFRSLFLENMINFFIIKFTE